MDGNEWREVEPACRTQAGFAAVWYRKFLRKISDLTMTVSGKNIKLNCPDFLIADLLPFRVGGHSLLSANLGCQGS